MLFESIFHDLRSGFRSLIKEASFSVVAIFALALGIATATTMFTFFDAVLLRPLPFFPDEKSLIVIRAVNSKDPSRDYEMSVPDFYDVRAQARTLVGVLTNENATYILNGGDRPKRVFGTWTTFDSFQILGVQPLQGRLFRGDEAKPGAPPVVIVSYNLWKESLGGRPDIIGQSISLNNAAATVIGVMPPNFHFPDANDLWQPYAFDRNAEEKHRGNHNTQVYARIKPGQTMQQVQAELDTIAHGLALAHPLTNTGVTFRAITVRQEATRDVSLALNLMMGAVVAVLMISCANVANLLLARSTTRAREFAVRLALGAGRARIVRQVLTESLLLGAVGAAAGLLLSSWQLDFFLGLIVDVPYWIQFEIDWRIATFVAVITVLASVLFGTLPALHLSQGDLARDLKDGVRGGTASGRAQRWRNLLVVLQMALALVLLVMGGLTMRSFLALHHSNVGFNASHVLTFRTGIPPTMESHDDVTRAFFERVEERLRAIPGVENAGFVTMLPLTESDDSEAFLTENMPEPAAKQDWPVATRRQATPGVLTTLQIPLLQGRLFNDHDRANTPAVALVDQNLARRYFPRGDAVGKRITFDPIGPKRGWMTIVGVVGNVVQQPTAREQGPAVWIPFAQDANNFATAVMRVQGEPARYIRAASDAVLSVRPDIPIYNERSMAEVEDRVLWKQRIFGSLFAGFALVALLLATIGIYGVMSYNVSQRQQEIGIRMALGAQPGAVVAMVVRHGIRLIVAGLALGLFGAWLGALTLTGMLHGIEPHDPPTFAFVPLLFALVALLACYLPGRRATLVDPLVALRRE